MSLPGFRTSILNLVRQTRVSVLNFLSVAKSQNFDSKKGDGKVCA